MNPELPGGAAQKKHKHMQQIKNTHLDMYTTPRKASGKDVSKAYLEN